MADNAKTIESSERPVRATDADLELRRIAAFKLRLEGRTQVYIAKKLNVGQQTVSAWLLGRFRGRATQTLTSPPAPSPQPHNGRPQYLTDDQLRSLLALAPPDHHVTGEEFRKAIRDAFGISYSLKHVWSILRYLRGGPKSRFEASRGATA